LDFSEYQARFRWYRNCDTASLQLGELTPMATLASDSSDTHPLDNPTATKPHESIALGELLRNSRERRGLSLQQIADETRIPLRHLQALESDNLGIVPAGLYRRAKIRAYARAVHFDQHALAQLERVLNAEAAAVTPKPASGHTTALPKSVLVALALIGVALVLALATRGGEDLVLSAPQPQGAIDPEPLPPAPAEQGQRATPAYEPSPDSSVATTGGPLPQPASVSTDAVVEPRVAQPLTTELLITSEPAGARVTVDGIGRGVTPVTIRHLPPGTRHIRVTKDGYQSEERAARVVGASLNALHISMRAVP
jgi:cytoskeletal protein RodZ